MKLRKWSYQKHKYEDVELPDSWYIPLVVSNMATLVNCPHCGKELPYGETYTSLEIHNWVGFGYGVCSVCYEKEKERKRKHELEA